MRLKIAITFKLFADIYRHRFKFNMSMESPLPDWIVH